MQEYVYRTFNLTPPEYERELSDALFSIMGRSVHDPDAIAAELNRSGPRPANGDSWSAELLKTEMKRLGAWTNCIGGPLGLHDIPGASRRTT